MNTNSPEMIISVVIPTCNRPESLARTLKSLAAQLDLPDEVIIVDASTISAEENDYVNKFPTLGIRYIHTQPSVCAQRNLGVQNATGTRIFLCDDDLEFPEDYILKIRTFLKTNSDVNVVSGLWLEKNEKGQWSYDFPIKSIGSLFWKFLFQQGIWCNIEKIKKGFWGKVFFRLVRNFYRKRKNTYSLAGWPLITHFETPFFKTAFYSLGACIINKEWLLASPFDEGLDSNGIGEHYGVALHFPEFPAIHVLMDTPVYHHKTDTNRPPVTEAFIKRVNALQGFMRQNKRFTIVNRIFLVWSLIGNALVNVAKGNTGHLKLLGNLTIMVLRTGKAKRSKINLDPESAYNLWASSYDRQPDNVILYLDDLLFNKMLNASVFESQVVVDIGCGTGRHWEKILAKKPSELIGYDISEEMLAILKKKNTGAVAHLLKGSILNYSKDGSCGRIVSTLAIGHIEKLEEVFTEWNRILKENGEVVITDFHPEALKKGAARTFQNNGKWIAVQSFIHPLDKVKKLAEKMDWKEIGFYESRIDSEVQHFFEKLKIMQHYKDAHHSLVLYGLHFRKR